MLSDYYPKWLWWWATQTIAPPPPPPLLLLTQCPVIPSLHFKVFICLSVTWNCYTLHKDHNPRGATAAQVSVPDDMQQCTASNEGQFKFTIWNCGFLFRREEETTEANILRGPVSNTKMKAFSGPLGKKIAEFFLYVKEKFT